MIETITNLITSVAGMGWGTVAGGIVALIVMIVGWILGKKVLKEINKKKQEVNESEARRKGYEALNKMKESGKDASEILNELYKLRKKKRKNET